MLFKSSIICLFALVQSLMPTCVSGQNQVKITTPQGSELWIYTPPGYPAAGSYPLLVSLLGGAEIGDGFNNILNATYANKGPSWLIANDQWYPDRPFIVITPKLERDPAILNPNNQVWDMNVLDEIIEHVCSQYQVDRNRVYLTGISLGAAACWSYAGTFPTKVAAIIPFAGNADRTLACQIKDIPVWVFHGTNDNFVRPDYFLPPNTVSSIGMVEAIKACNGFYTPQLNMLHAKAHEGWNQLYSETLGYDIYTWLLQFRKGEFVNSPPYVSAGRDLRVLNNSGPLYLSAFAFDVDSEIVEFFWEQISGPTLSTELVDSTFLKISNLITGTFNFRLTARDAENEVTSKVVKLEVFDSLTTISPVATGFVLRNGSAKTDVRPLLKEDFINLYTEGLTSINIRANTLATPSLRFIVNNDLDTRTSPNAPNPFYIYIPLSGPNEWIVPVGKYTICGVPYSGTGASGQIGIMYCSRLDVYNQPPRTYFAKPNTDISQLSSWGLSPNGSGSAPPSFQENFQTFIINSEVRVDNTLPIKGVLTTLVVKSGGKLIINDSIAIPVSVEAGGSVEVNTTHQVKWGSIDVESTIKFGLLSNFIPGATYGNIEITGQGSTKSLDASLIRVEGSLIMDDAVVLQGASNGRSTLRLGNTADIGNIEFPDSAYWFNVQLDAGGAQSLSFAGTTLSLKQLTVTSGTQASFSGDFELQIASKNKGLIVEDGSSLSMGSNTIKLIGGSTINSNQETGILNFSGGALIFNTETANASFLNVDENENALSRLLVNIRNGGSVHILDTLVIVDSVSITNGTIFANGNLVLASTPDKTSFIGAISGNGQIIGNIQLQRSIGSGRQYRYLSIPLYNVPVSQIQSRVPVTGTFTGASTGGSLSSNPSLFYYNELAGGWNAFPHSSNDEVFTVGNGYALFVRDYNNPTLLKLNGEIHQGDFEFSLVENEDEFDTEVGWNLIGNPFPAPINWGGPGWTNSGVNSTASIRDNTYPGGRFLSWDGEAGDPEFGGTIALGQGFWVRSTSLEPQLVISETAKRNQGGHDIYRVSDDFSFNSTTEVLVVSLRMGELVDRTYVKFNNGTSSFDSGRDGLKQMNGYFNIFSLTDDSISVAIKNSPPTICDTAIPLGVNGLTVGGYQLEFNTVNFDALRLKNLHLKDNYLDSLVSLDVMDSYTFFVDNEPYSFKTNRFELVSINSMTQPQISQVAGKLVSSASAGNQWYLNGELIPGAITNELEPAEPGDYRVEVTYKDCSVFSEDFTFMVTDIGNPPDICQVYPNPTKGQILVKCSSGSDLQCNLEIRNMLGFVVKNEILSFDEGLANFSIDHEPAGLYFIRISSYNNSTFIKVIKE